VSSLELTPAQVADVLEHGDLEVVGRMRYSSNATFLVEASADGVTIGAVYKPRRGERPLWDFPDGTLCQREVAAYEVSHALGWGIVPVTVMRDDGPLGPGALQRFVEHDPEEHYFTLLEHHPDRFRQFAVLDVLLNNTDRKGGHCLRDLVDDQIIGIDHGLTFHPAWKLRTVIWDFAGEPVPPALADDLCRVVADAETGDLGARLSMLLSPPELAAFATRATDLVRDGQLPDPDPGYHSVPWPLV
jgi:Phosphatidylinositol 3- and 4-kinase